MKPVLKKVTFFIFFSISIIKIYPCTILSGIDANGHILACNNEDWMFTFKNYINVFPSAAKGKLGYFTLTYGDPNSEIEGGVNEAGLFFDFNALPEQKYKLKEGRKPYPGGRDSMMLYILANCKNVPDVLKLWETYYRPGMSGAQMHLADARGNLVVITPDSIIWATKTHLTSTNFTLCDPDPRKYKCWRYPIAERLFAKEGVSKQTFLKIADSTHQRTMGSTIYTNLHDLTTGDVWFYYAEDYKNSWHTNIHTLIKQGKQSILIRNLFPQNNAVRLYNLINNGAEEKKITHFLDQGHFTDMEKESMLRLCYTDYLLMEKNIAHADFCYQHWMKYIHLNKYMTLPRSQIEYIQARHAAFIGDYEKAKQLINSPEHLTPNEEKLKQSLDGKPNSTDNVVLKLKGYENANTVFVEVNDDLGLYRFLNKTKDGWEIHFLSSAPEILYVFFVDGKRVLDLANDKKKKDEDIAGVHRFFNIYEIRAK